MSGDRGPMGAARLAAIIKSWCDENHVSLAEFCRRAGISRMTLNNIQRGTIANLRTDTKEGIEQVLGWKSGSVDAVLVGREPTPRDPESEPTPALEGGWTGDGVPVDEEGRPWTPERIWATLQFVRESSPDDPLAWYRALYTAAERWGIPSAPSNQSRQAG